MGSRARVVGDVRGNDPVKPGCIEHDHVIEFTNLLAGVGECRMEQPRNDETEVTPRGYSRAPATSMDATPTVFLICTTALHKRHASAGASDAVMRRARVQVC